MSPDDDLTYVMQWINEFIQFIDAHDGTARVKDILRHIDERKPFTDEDGYWEGADIISSMNEFIEYLIARDGEEFTNEIMRRIHERRLFTDDEWCDAYEYEKELEAAARSEADIFEDILIDEDERLPF